MRVKIIIWALEYNEMRIKEILHLNYIINKFSLNKLNLEVKNDFFNNILWALLNQIKALLKYYLSLYIIILTAVLKIK